MADRGVKLILSCVSGEFGGYPTLRCALRGDGARQNLSDSGRFLC
jgi:hypothetical protein